MEYDEMFDIAAKNVVKKDWDVTRALIDELRYPFRDSREDRTNIQLKTITFILKMFDEGKKAILLDAPTGTGKSLINMTVAINMKGDSFITLPQKILQRQYVNEFTGLCTEIKGRNNYICRMVNASCAEGSCRQSGKYKCKEYEMCDYWTQKELALDAKVCISNFTYFFLEGGNAFSNRELMVIDEGDDVAESSILDLCSVTLSHRTLRSLYDYIDFKMDDMEILASAKELLKEEIDDTVKNGVRSLVDVKELDAFRDLYSRIGRVEDDWISQRDKTFVKGRHGSLRPGLYDSFVFKPLSISKFAEMMLWSRTEKYIVSSATILNKDMYVKETGLDFLDPDDIVYVTMDSPFDKARRPIYYLGNKIGKLTAKEMSGNLPKAIDEIIRIAGMYPDERGLLHCTSFKNVTSISNMLNMSDIADRMIYHTNMTDRNELVSMMMLGQTPKDSIVVSPSLTRGVDLKYDRCRFNIIFKTPYANTLDKRIRIRSSDFRWYSTLALREVIQSYGRGMRAENDECATFVLDAGFRGLVNGVAKKSVPNWFREAIVWK